MCLSHIIHDRHVSITVAIIITVTYKITIPNKLLTCTNCYKECLKIFKQAFSD